MSDQKVSEYRRLSPARPDPSATDGLGWIPYLAICGAGLTLGLTWIGPSAAEGLGTLNAMAFWAAHVGPALGLLALTQTSLSRLRRVASLSGLAQVLLTAIVASLLFTPVALGVDLLFDVEPSRDDEGEPLLLVAALEFAQFAVPIGLTWTLINAPSLMRIEAATPRPTPQDDAPVEAEARSAQAEFWARIPRRLGRDIIAMSAELHYLRVYTTLGNTLILYPFGRATDAIVDVQGMQVHRSHWVALDRVDEVTTQDGRTFCHVTGGLVLPVSRSHRTALRAALGKRA
jgi:hypothetical protein